MYKLNLILIFSLLVSCQESDTSREDSSVKNSIYSEVIQNLPLMPPPSMEILGDEKLYKEYIDSISKLPVRIFLLNKTIKPNLSQYSFPKEFEQYKYLLPRLESSLNDFQDFEIKKNANQQIIKSEKPPSFEKNVDTISWYVRFSPIVLDSHTGLGLFYTSFHLSNKGGEYILVLLEKSDIGNNWIIKEYLTIEIS